MLTVEEAVKKLYEQPAIFMHHLRRKEYREAHFTRMNTAAVAMFLELPEEQMDKLFGSKQDLENVKIGLFPEEACMMAEKWCVFHDEGYQSITYVEVMNKLWAKKEAQGKGLLGA